MAFTPLDSLNPTTEKSSENTPAASAILGSIAARTNLTQAEEYTAAPQEEVPSANAAQNDITIDSLMRYD